MSIERYLQAPLEDEAASVPAINAALKDKSSPSWTEPNRTRRVDRQAHSRNTSYDANSEGRRTFYTSASGQESTGTSLSIGARSYHHRSTVQLTMPRLPGIQTGITVHDGTHSTIEPTMESARTLIDQFETSPPANSIGIAYRARIEAELARIQGKARRLEGEVRRFKEQKDNEELLVPRITDEVIHQQMALKPKLAWILGGENVHTSVMERPSTSASATGTVDTWNDMPSRPTTSGRPTPMPEQAPRRVKSSSALIEESHWPNDKSSSLLVGRKSSKRPKFFCTFCQKRFHNRVR